MVKCSHTDGREGSDQQVLASSSPRIRSFPLNSGLPSSISAMMQPADQISTGKEGPLWDGSFLLSSHACYWDEGKVTGLCVVHPVEDDLWRSVPAGHNIAGHLCVRLPRQAEIQDLE